MKTTLYTPVMKETGQRIKLQVVSTDKKPFRNGWKGRATLKNGKSYLIESKPCGLRCHCDAWIIGYDGKIKTASN